MVLYVCDASTGTFIDQGEDPDFYFQKYPEDNPVLGFFTWRWVLTLGFDHMYSSPVFLGTLVLLGASLMAYTYTTQIPLVKVARRSNWMIVIIIYYFAFSHLGPLWLRMSWRNLSITELGWYLYMQMEFLRLFWGYPQAGIFRHFT